MFNKARQKVNFAMDAALKDPENEKVKEDLSLARNGLEKEQNKLADLIHAREVQNEKEKNARKDLNKVPATTETSATEAEVDSN